MNQYSRIGLILSFGEFQMLKFPNGLKLELSEIMVCLGKYVIVLFWFTANYAVY